MLKKSNQKGFTIIEVLIVLAIAGLIMLIVFLAVPALQRNSRNTQVRNGASAVLSTANEFVANNNGTLPTTVTIAADGTITVSGAAGTASATSKTQSGYAASVSVTPPATDVKGTFALAVNRQCAGSVLQATATPRAIAVLYNVETASSTTPQCTST